MKLSGYTKNMIAFFIIVVVLTFIGEYFQLNMLIWLINFFGIVIWILITPFNFEHND
jgi:FtsH-binding integral membrane protein